MKSDDLKSGPKKLKTASEHGIQAPLALLAELSHRCPLQCPYCSNPVQLEKKTGELTTEEWKSVIDQAVDMGMHQIHLSGGEPTVRHDLEDIVTLYSQGYIQSNHLRFLI